MNDLIRYAMPRRECCTTTLSPDPNGQWVLYTDAITFVLTWTTQKPTVRGWYWFRAPKHGWRDSIVWLERDGNDGELYMPDDDSTSVNEIDGEWAGPIPTPKEAS